ncbi:peptidyl-prolyl cis-trans isomerase [Qipengyuania sp. ASV99]|uniref:peptidylprolyl isomerase n=1 Tax=Qipengyuania sp. ASV99 TaxID=3399681 RepID=UPI003A4C59D0
MTLPGWTREPLVHFLGLGAIVYFALTWGGTPVDPASRVISVDAEQQAQLALGFEQVMGRAPTDAELDARIDRYVRDEVLYREALRLGLDQDDAVVRQRMVAKMDLSASAAAEIAQAGEAALRTYFEANREKYTGAALVSFDQVYFADEARARAALGEAGTRAAPSGEPISLPPSVDGSSMRDVQNRLGEQFARALAELAPSERWQGPVPSGFGWHLVRLRDRRSAEPEFEAIRSRVENDWRSAQIADRKQRAFDVLRSAYRVEIDQ